MKKRISIQVLLLVLLIVTSLPIAVQSDYPENSKSVSVSPQHSVNSIPTDTSTSNITWTSRTQKVPQIVGDNFVIDGDHVVFNATFFPALNVTECNLTIWNPNSGINASVSSSGSSITYDTYYLDRTNQTYDIKVNGTTVANDFVILLRENVTICNFFVPKTMIEVNPIAPESLVFNFSWSCEDQNENDENYFSIWLSREDGVTFVLLLQNYTRTWYVWNSTDWLLGIYYVRIRAYSVDFSSSECRVDDPPLSYWPGDYSDTISNPNQGGGVHTGMPTSYFDINTDTLSYEFGSTGNTISVFYTISSNPPPPTEIEYYVTDNLTQWIQGVFNPTASSFTINIDGLSIGTHEISIRLSYFGPYDREYLIVVVTAPANMTPTSTPQDWNPIIQTLAIGISIGSITVIALVLILSLQLKRKQIIEYV